MNGLKHSCYYLPLPGDDDPILTSNFLVLELWGVRVVVDVLGGWKVGGGTLGKG